MTFHRVESAFPLCCRTHPYSPVQSWRAMLKRIDEELQVHRVKI
jgi:hypothetical protein